MNRSELLEKLREAGIEFIEHQHEAAMTVEAQVLDQ